MNTLMFLLIVMLPQNTPKFPHPEFVVKTYPDTVMPGDTFYFSIVARNPHAESIHIMAHYAFSEDNIRISLRDPEKQTQALLPEGGPIHADYFRRFAEIKPGDSRIICETAINVPPLEDLKEPFWEKHLRNLPGRGKNLMLCTTIKSLVKSNEGESYKVESFTFETPLLLKPRPENEMARIRKWLDDTPKRWLPGPYNGQGKIWPIDAQGGYLQFKNILVKGENVSQQNFMRRNNRYPSHPNAPETWQGWKELEDSLTPSTMRDEIRLTRILIQYCDTEDDAVLDELKEWFADMNEVQRGVFAALLRYLPTIQHFPYNDRNIDPDLLFPSLREIYKTIREYDKMSISKAMEDHQQGLGLIE